jgi:hypothetical protein
MNRFLCLRCAGTGRLTSDDGTLSMPCPDCFPDVSVLGRMAVGASVEAVDHPAHYGGADDPFEPIKIIEARGWGEGFCLGNAIKYLLRAGRKPGQSAVQDLKKARWYLDRLITSLEGKDDGDPTA